MADEEVLHAPKIQAGWTGTARAGVALPDAPGGEAVRAAETSHTGVLRAPLWPREGGAGEAAGDPAGWRSGRVPTRPEDGAGSISQISGAGIPPWTGRAVAPSPGPGRARSTRLESRTGCRVAGRCPRVIETVDSCGKYPHFGDAPRVVQTVT